MTSLACALMMAASSIGGGVALLRVSGTLESWAPRERLVFGFALGVGLLGWLAFIPAWLHVLSWPVYGAMLLAGLGGWWWAWPALRQIEVVRVNWFTASLVGALMVVLGMDVLEALAPPVDADSLAYHFATPKTFIESGGLVPIMRAGDGAVPLLHQMTYMLAMLLGGELAMTLWTMMTGWGVAAVAYVTARRYLEVDMSLLVCLLILTLPAVVYGAGTGQVETRNAMFTLFGAVCAAEALRTKRFGFLVLAGLAAGFYIGGKYTGLLYAFACGLVIICQRNWLAAGSLYSLVAVIAGGQWYLWNWWITGDPIFPTLYGFLPYHDAAHWNDAVNAAYWTMRDESVLPKSLFWLFAYPLKAVLAAHPAFESLRVGLGPVAVILLPFAAACLFRGWREIAWRPLLVFAAIAALTYCLWFFLGTSQRIRYLLPIFPIVLIVLAVLGERAARDNTAMSRALLFGLLASCAIQIGGHLIFTLGYAERLVRNEGRDAFLSRNVLLYDVVPWINQNLSRPDRLLLVERQLAYFIDVPVFYGLDSTQGAIEMHGDARDLGKFGDQLEREKISHVLIHKESNKVSSPSPLGRFVARLTARGCAAVEVAIAVDYLQSRTLQITAPENNQIYQVVRLDRTCAPEQ